MLLNYSRAGGQSAFGPISAGQGPPRGLVKTHANNWSSRMQMAGQWQCKRVVKRNAIRQLVSGLFFVCTRKLYMECRFPTR